MTAAARGTTHDPHVPQQSLPSPDPRVLIKEMR